MSEKKMSLLIAEDTRATRELLDCWFDHSIFEIEFAENGAEALQKFKRVPYDLVLTDLQMPVLDGLSVIRRIRELEEQGQCKHRTPVVAFTAGVTEFDRKTCIEAGADAYLEKPIDLEGLFTLVDELSHAHPKLCQAEARSKKNAATLSSGAATKAASSTKLNAAEFDKPAALARIGGNEELFATLVAFFLEDHVGCMEEIKLGLQNSDAVRVCTSAHALKGQAASVGGNLVALAAQRLEDSAGEALDTLRSTDEMQLNAAALEAKVADLVLALNAL